LVLLSALSFGLMPIFARFAYRNGVEVQELLFVRFTLASVTLGLLLASTGKASLPPKRQVLTLLALGGIGYFVQSTLYFTALLYVPVSIVSLALYTYPAFVSAGSLTLGWERVSARLILSLLLALAGLVLVVNPVLNVAPLGLLMALGAAVTYTAYILVSTRALRGTRNETASLLVMVAAAVTFGISLLPTGRLQINWSAEAWLWALMISLISTALAITVFFQGLQLIGPSRASVLSVSELIISVFAASILFNEALSLTQLLGGSLIFFATVLAARSENAARNEAHGLSDLPRRSI